MSQKTPCSRCGYLNRVNEVACLQCGTRFEPVPATRTASPPPPGINSGMPAYPSQPGYPPSGSGHSPAYPPPSAGPASAYVNGPAANWQQREIAGVWRSGKQLVCESGTVLPNICIKCNAPSTHRVGKTLTREPAWVGLLILPGVLPYFIFRVFLKESGRIEYGLCSQHRSFALVLSIAAWSLFSGSLLSFALYASRGWSDALTFGIFLGVLAAIFGVGVHLTGIQAAKIEGDFLWIEGVSPAFLDRLPPS